MRALVVVLILGFVLSGCSMMDKEESDDRYSMRYDKAPTNPPDVSNVPDAVPVHLPYSRGGNRSTYTVWGKQYAVMDSHIGYVEEGIASWYGLKFHGHKTANGEIYDIYKMSAAHKSLPIPSFARVTNLENGKEVVVRVNDRGPFHGDRLIDLSYAAAERLGMAGKGVARVRVESIDARRQYAEPAPVQMAQHSAPQSQMAAANVSDLPPVSTYLQVGSFGNPANAERVQQQLASTLSSEVNIVEVDSNGRRLHRVMVGPIAAGLPLDRLIQQIMAEGFAPPMLINSP